MFASFSYPEMSPEHEAMSWDKSQPRRAASVALGLTGYELPENVTCVEARHKWKQRVWVNWRKIPAMVLKVVGKFPWDRVAEEEGVGGGGVRRRRVGCVSLHSLLSSR